MKTSMSEEVEAEVQNSHQAGSYLFKTGRQTGSQLLICKSSQWELPEVTEKK
jgi:hypothetical protein